MADPAVVATWIAVVLIAALIVTASHRVERSEYLGHFFFFSFSSDFFANYIQRTFLLVLLVNLFILPQQRGRNEDITRHMLASL